MDFYLASFLLTTSLHFFFLDGRDGWHIEIPLNGFILDENVAFVDDGEQTIAGKGSSK